MNMHQPMPMTDEPPARPASKLTMLRRRVRELERENRRLRIRYGLACGGKVMWEDYLGKLTGRMAADEMQCRLSKGTLLDKPIRLGDGTPEQERHDEPE